MPAPLIPWIPACASSKPIASPGATWINSHALTKISGSGLPFVKVAGSTMASNSSMTPNFSRINGAFLEAEAIAQGIPSA